MANFWTGSKDQIKQTQNYSPQQLQLLNQILQQYQSSMGGAFNQLNSQINDEDPLDFNAIEAPIMQQYQEDIIPGILERFAGQGASSSSAMNQTLARSGKDLSQGLAAQRAGMSNQRMQIKQNAMNLLQQYGSQGLSQQTSPYVQQGSKGFLDYGAQGMGALIGSWLR